MNKKLINLGLGLVVGAIGGKILASDTVKKLAVNSVAGGLKIKEGIDKNLENVKVTSEDILAEAKIKKAEDEKKEAERKAQVDIEKVAETEVVEEEVEDWDDCFYCQQDSGEGSFHLWGTSSRS